MNTKNQKYVGILSLAVGSLMALSTSVWAGTASKCEDMSLYPEISKTELTQVAKSGSAVIIDVNSDASFKKNHVPGAVHFSKIEKDLASVLPAQEKDKMIVAYCGGPKCEAWKKAAQAACEQGFTNIRHFKGGIQEWSKKSI